MLIRIRSKDMEGAKGARERYLASYPSSLNALGTYAPPLGSTLTPLAPTSNLLPYPVLPIKGEGA